MGASVQRVEADGCVSSDTLRRAASEGGCSVALSADILAGLSGTPLERGSLEKVVGEHCDELLVFNCNDSVRHGEALSWLTGGAVRDVSSSEENEALFAIPARTRGVTRQFAGRDFRGMPRGTVATFDTAGGTGTGVEVLMSAAGRPAFVRVERPAFQAFLLAGTGVVDVADPAPEDESTEPQYDRLIPLLIFVRQAFGRQSWHGPPSTASLIIDDPLLSRRYGCLDYRALRDSMARLDFATTIAFIPWNHWRTSRRTASELVSGPGLSVCVHGCDHTRKEFDSADVEALGNKARLALERMESHERRTGVRFDPVMVFPQGQFSLAAMSALRDNGYLAAVNSICAPASGERTGLIVGDLLKPAITRYGGFPLFRRRYPRQLIEFALDLFLGRPALIVEHHEYFMDRGARLEELVGGLREIQPDLTWPTLGSQLGGSCLLRSAQEGYIEAEFFTRSWRFRNQALHPLQLAARRYEPDPASVTAVTIDGEPTPFSRRDDGVEIEVEIGADQTVDVEVLYGPSRRRASYSLGIRHNARVTLRRALSEFRDKTLVRHPKLLRIAKGLARKLRTTGDGS